MYHLHDLASAICFFVRVSPKRPILSDDLASELGDRWDFFRAVEQHQQFDVAPKRRGDFGLAASVGSWEAAP